MKIVLLIIASIAGLYLFAHIIFPVIIAIVFIVIITKVVKAIKSSNQMRYTSSYFDDMMSDHYLQETAKIEKYKAEEAKYRAKEARSRANTYHAKSDLFFAKTDYLNAKAEYNDTKIHNRLLRLYKEHNAKKNKEKYVFCSYCGSKNLRVNLNCHKCGGPLK